MEKKYRNLLSDGENKKKNGVVNGVVPECKNENGVVH